MVPKSHIGFLGTCQDELEMRMVVGRRSRG